MRWIKTYKIFEATQELTPEQVKWLNKCTSVKEAETIIPSIWTIDSEGRIDIPNDFYDRGDGTYKSVHKSRPDFMGLKFGKVGRSFIVNGRDIGSLEGSPYEVGGSFYCEDNVLTSLKGAPQRVGAHFLCSHNPLGSLKGAPQEFGYSKDPLYGPTNRPQFGCNSCNLEDLEGSPQYVPGNFNCLDNPLKSLKGGPREVGGSFNCRNENMNTLFSLDGAPLRVGGSFICNYFVVRSGLWGTQEAFVKLFIGHKDPHIEIEPENLERVRTLIHPFIEEEAIDSYFIENPLEMDILDPLPEVKAGVLRRTGLRDTSLVARSIKKGLI